MSDDAPVSRRGTVSASAAFAMAGLLLVTLAAYVPVLRAGFLAWDDNETIADNPLLNDPGFHSLAWYWQRPHMNLYVPVTYTAWTAIAAVATRWFSTGDGTIAPLPFHAANLILHLITTLLVYRLIRPIARHPMAAVVGATLFALHPVQLEAVAWTSGLKDVLSTLLMFGAASCWLRSGDAKSRGRWIALATLLYVAAMLSKPTAVVTPLVTWLLCVAHGLSPRRAAKSLIPWLVLALPCLLITRLVQPAIHEEVVALWQRPIVAMDAIAGYLVLLAWPTRLAVDHGRTPSVALATAHAYVAFAIGTAGVLGATLATRRWGIPSRRTLSAIGLFVAGLLPVLGLATFDFQAVSTVAEHYLYPAMLGVSMLAALALSNLRPLWSVAVAAALAAILAPLTYRQSKTWRDDETFFRQVLSVNPNSWVAYNALSAEALKRTEPHEAARLAQLAIDRNRRYARAWVNLASAQSVLGDRDLALASLIRAYQIDPRSPTISNNLGGLLAEKGATEPAIPLLTAAVEAAPTDASARLNLGTALLQTGQAPRALNHPAEAARLRPNDPAVLTRYAVALAMSGRRDAARLQLNRALALDPRFTAAIEELARIDAPAATQTIQTTQPAR